MGFALHLAQLGQKHEKAKPMKGFGGAGVVEIVEDEDGATFRTVYTVNFDDGIYVLNAFQKKSVKGIKTPQVDINRVKTRLKDAREIYNERKRKREKQKKDGSSPRAS
jgi:phage-related protein